MIARTYIPGQRIMAKYTMYDEFEPATVKSCRKAYGKDCGSVRVIFDDPLNFKNGVRETSVFYDKHLKPIGGVV